MKVYRSFAVCVLAALTACQVMAQTPTLSSIEAPYPALSRQIQMAGSTFGSGSVNYGPVGTPLVLSGSSFGDGGTVQFVSYHKNQNNQEVTGAVVQAIVTLWTPTMLLLTVPSGATSGLVTVTSGGEQSNALPFIVMPGAYAGSCPAPPSNNQLQIITSELDDGVVGESYDVTLEATGGVPTYSWAITNGSLPAGLTLNASTGVISGTPTTSVQSLPLTVQVTDSTSPNLSVSAVLDLTIDSSGNSAVVYSYSIPSTGGYDSVGNVLAYTDSVTGTWSMATSSGGSGYDSFNRLVAAQATAGPYAGLQASWSYDSFGNRLTENFSGDDTGDAPVPASSLLTYNANNQVQTVSSGSAPIYDPSGDGDMIKDSQNQQYLYDAEGRLCAVNSSSGMFGYLYDAEGNRVAKGTITSWNCDTNPSDQAYNHFMTTASYILGPADEQLTELAWSGGTAQWAHTNVFAGSAGLIATYTPNSNQGQPGVLNFYLTDWLGTRRVMTDATGNVAENCPSLPYGDGEGCAPTPTEHLFTGKERDSESGNDYFGARYYASTMGRFLSPDWSAQATPVPYATMGDPQSLNLYSYMRNNPLGGTDPDGHCDIGCQIGIVMGIVNGIQRDGGVGPYAHNVGVGALKGLGQAAYSTGAILNAGFSGNPYSLASTLMNQPAAITPSNTTQAQAAFITSTTVTVAATLPAAPEVEAAEVAAQIPGEALMGQAVAARDALAAEVGASKATVTGAFNSETGQVTAAACGGGQCAEDVANGQLQGGATNFTKAIRPRTGNEVPICERCESTYGRDKFPPDAQFKSDKPQ